MSGHRRPHDVPIARLAVLLKERGVDYAPGGAQDAAADKAALRWMDRQADGRKPE